MSRIVLIGALAVVLALSGAALVYAQDSGATANDTATAEVCNHEGEGQQGHGGMGGHQGHAGGDQTAHMQEMIDSGQMAEMVNSDHFADKMGAEKAAEVKSLIDSGNIEGLKAFMEAQRATHHQ